MIASNIRVGDIGTRFLVTVKESGLPVDISTATTKEIIFKSPSAAAVNKTATFFTNGSDGKIYYDLQSGDIDVEGTWKIQAYIVTPAGNWKSSTDTFVAQANLA